MLYDNGALLGLLAEAWRERREDLYARCAAQTAGWMMREMQSPEGGYYSSFDADSEGAEGKFYVWDRDDVRRLLTAEAYAASAAPFGLDQPPNFERRHWHLQGLGRLDGAMREKLLAARQERVRPGRDEKILVSWNALAIRGMAQAGRVLGNDVWVASARRALQFVRSAMWRNGRLAATYKDGRAHLNAYLDDYALLIAALLELLQDKFSADQLAFATQLAEVLLEQFEDRAEGGFFFTARDHEKLIHRPKPAYDHATPSGNALAAWSLNRLAALTGESRYALAAQRTLELFSPALRANPGGHAMMAIALDEYLAQPELLVLRGEPGALESWRAELAREIAPRTQLLAIADGVAGLPAPLDKPRRPPPVTAWLCRGTACREPIDDRAELRKILKQQA
jgi:hypothetical protein